MNKKSLFGKVSKFFKSTRNKAIMGVGGLGLITSSLFGQNIMDGTQYNSYKDFDVGKTSTTILMSKDDVAKPDGFRKDGKYSIFTNPETRFPTKAEVLANGLDSNAAYAIFNVNSKDTAKYPTAGISLYKGNKEISFALNKSSNKLFVPIDDFSKADSYKRFAFDKNNKIIASFKGHLNNSSNKESLNELLQAQDRIEYAVNHPELGDLQDALKRRSELSGDSSYVNNSSKIVSQDTSLNNSYSEKSDLSDLSDLSDSSQVSNVDGFEKLKQMLDGDTSSNYTVITKSADTLKLVPKDSSSVNNSKPLAFTVEPDVDLADSSNSSFKNIFSGIYFDAKFAGSLGDANSGSRVDALRFTKKPSFAVEGGVIVGLSKHVDVDVGVGYENVSGKNMITKKHFSSTNFTGDIKFNYTPLNIDLGEKLYLNPSAFIGAGLTYYDAKSDVNGAPFADANGIVPSLGVGLRLGFDISSKININLEGSTKRFMGPKGDESDAISGGNGVKNSDWMEYIGVGLEFKLNSPEKKTYDNLDKVVSSQYSQARGDSARGADSRLAKALGYDKYDANDSVQKNELSDTLIEMSKYTTINVTKNMDLDSLAKTLTYDDAEEIMSMYVDGTVKDTIYQLSEKRNLTFGNSNFYNFIDALSDNFDFENHTKLPASRSRINRNGSKKRFRKSDKSGDGLVNIYKQN